MSDDGVAPHLCEHGVTPALSREVSLSVAMEIDAPTLRRLRGDDV